GQLVAIMGSSGAGKSTLLNCLSGRVSVGHLTGNIHLNGRQRNPRTWKKTVSFVEQDDIMYASLTVRETLRFAAQLRLPSSRYTDEQKFAKAEEILRSLRLTKAADTFIGDGMTRGISGGERKRTAIGQELVGDPEILFLDEPTSGLDSNSAFMVIENVKSEAVRTNRIVILTIHQPSHEILALFSSVILLSAGSVVFYGPPDDALAHFSGLGIPCPPRKNPGGKR
ncbi:P-loop containing nucleoside triphosphate hydrolase protein, partial [Blyttiomyces helicus]